MTIEQQIEKFLQKKHYAIEKNRKYSYTLLSLTKGEKFNYISRKPLAVNMTVEGQHTGVIFEHGDKCYRVDGRVKFWEK